eukprot:4544442-Pleurochrysis_carterae.AAC.2
MSHIKFCDSYRFAPAQIRWRVAAPHSSRTARDGVASASAAKFDAHPPSPRRQATYAAAPKMK